MIVLVHEIMTNGQMLHQSNINHANLVGFFRGSKYLLKIGFSNVYFSNISNKNRVQNDIDHSTSLSLRTKSQP